MATYTRNGGKFKYKYTTGRTCRVYLVYLFYSDSVLVCCMATPRRVYRVSEQKIWNPKIECKYSVFTDCPLIYWNLPPDFTKNLGRGDKITPANNREISITPRMPINTRSKTSAVLKPVSKEEWNAVEALLFLKKPVSTQAPKQKRPHRSSATYTPGTFAGMEE